MVYSEGFSNVGYSTGLRLISDGLDFLGRSWLAFFAALLLACFASSDKHVLKGVEAGTNAEAEDASSAIDAMERTFMVETRIYYRNFEVMTTKRV